MTKSAITIDIQTYIFYNIYGGDMYAHFSYGIQQNIPRKHIR